MLLAGADTADPGHGTYKLADESDLCFQTMTAHAVRSSSTKRQQALRYHSSMIHNALFRHPPLSFVI